MKIVKKISLQGEYVKAGVDIKDGDFITILDEGTIIPGDFGDRHTFKIDTPKGEKLMSFNQTSLNNLVDAYGEETSGWIDKKIKVFIVKQMVGNTLRNVAYLTGEGWDMDGEGRFFKVNTQSKRVSSDDIPIVEEE